MWPVDSVRMASSSSTTEKVDTFARRFVRVVAHLARLEQVVVRVLAQHLDPAVASAASHAARAPVVVGEAAERARRAEPRGRGRAAVRARAVGGRDARLVERAVIAPARQPARRVGRGARHVAPVACARRAPRSRRHAPSRPSPSSDHACCVSPRPPTYRHASSERGACRPRPRRRRRPRRGRGRRVRIVVRGGRSARRRRHRRVGRGRSARRRRDAAAGRAERVDHDGRVRGRPRPRQAKVAERAPALARIDTLAST